jgi:dinuclear metal center YbgI/SA1388 family protein
VVVDTTPFLFYGRWMQATAKDIIKLIDGEASFNCAEDWDNSGLQAGDTSWHVKSILIALDPTLEVLEEAASIGADLVLTHHPLFIDAPKCIDFSCMPGLAIAISAKEKISIVSAHTNLDKAQNGLNDYFAKVIGLNEIHSLHDAEDDSCSLGRKGRIDSEITLKSFALEIKEKLGLDYIRVIGDGDLLINSAAVITGSGGSMIEDFFQSKADVFITGDIKYHEARIVEANNSGMIDVGHFGSEYIAIQLLFDKLINASKNNDYDFKIFKYEKESDPFNIV